MTSRMIAVCLFGFAGMLLAVPTIVAEDAAAAKKLVIIAGKPSHPPGMHEFNAGVQLLADCLQKVDGLQTQFVLNGWPADEAVLADADAIVFYMDGGGKHEVVKEDGRRLKMIDELTKKGVGVGFMHYGVEVLPGDAGPEFKRWIGGHYENMHSCNPIWEPVFAVLPEHEVTSGVKPFQAKDEWYFNMRFVSDITGNQPAQEANLRFQPILYAVPSDDVRDGPYVYPRGPYAHIQQSSGRSEAMMWVVEREDGGRGFGFTGGHFHDNWSIDSYRKVVLNAMVWLAQADVPEGGVESSVSAKQLKANLDLKQPRKKK